MNDQCGGAVTLMLAAVGLLALLIIGLADAGVIIAARHQAAAAADAAALAAAPVTFRAFGAAGTASHEAARFAAMNGASVVSCRCRVDRSWRARTVEVVVERTVRLVGGGALTVRARSTAEFDPAQLVSPRR